MFDGMDEANPYFVGSVLEATHQEGKYPTQYSNIYDLKNKIIFLFHFHNYEEYLTINLEEELAKGIRYFSISPFFSRVKLINPQPGQELDNTGTEFSWEGIEGNHYELVYSTDSTFAEYTTLEIAGKDVPLKEKTFPVYLVAGFLLLILPVLGRKKIAAGLMIILLLSNIQCNKEDDQDNSGPPVIKHFETINDLEPGITYYWKIRAQSPSNPEFFTQTPVRSFSIL